MKKRLLTAVTAAAAISLFGCSMAQVEKAPIVIEDSAPDAITPNGSDELTAIPTKSTNQTDAGTNSDETTVNPDEAAVNADETDVNADETAANSDETAVNSDGSYTSTITLEGTEETVNYQIYHSNLGYHMAYDKDRFTVTSDNGTDSFIAENPDPDLYPYVYVNISRYDLKEIKEKAEITYADKDNNISKEPRVQFDPMTTYWFSHPNDTNQSLNYFRIKGGPDQIDKSSIFEEKIGNYPAYTYSITEGDKWNSKINHFYFITTDNYVYQIETQYFAEASEGYGARISEMLKTFDFE